MTLGLTLALVIAMLAISPAASAGAETTALADSAKSTRSPKSGLAGATLVVMRHAEKPNDRDGGDSGLSPAGRARAKAYVDYFRSTKFGDAPLHITDLIAATDTSNSVRPRLTVTPLGKALDLPIQQPFADDQVGALADWLSNGRPDRTVLIVWRHHKLPALLVELGADPALLLPGGAWPKDTFDWLVVLKYDAQGKLKSAERLVEPGMDAFGGLGAR
jgi:hypothetical protein